MGQQNRNATRVGLLTGGGGEGREDPKEKTKEESIIKGKKDVGRNFKNMRNVQFVHRFRKGIALN